MKRLILLAVLLIILGMLFSYFNTSENSPVLKNKDDTTVVNQEEDLENQEKVLYQAELDNDVSRAAKHQLDIDREKIPTMIKIANKYKACLSAAHTKDQAIACYKKTNTYAKSLGVPDKKAFNPEAEFGDWGAEQKQRILQGMGKAIQVMESVVATP